MAQCPFCPQSKVKSRKGRDKFGSYNWYCTKCGTFF